MLEFSYMVEESPTTTFQEEKVIEEVVLEVKASEETAVLEVTASEKM